MLLQLSSPEIGQYGHSAIHHAVALRDYASLRSILAKLPTSPKAGEIVSEEESVAAEAAADNLSAVVDRRDVPNRETPLHLAVRLGDAASVELLMAAGADWSLQNEQGWSALQEAVCAREEGIAMIITRYYQPFAWAKWCRRLPRITGTFRRMKDFYMEITFNFESSVIPFISRIAPSDTYRIWKRGSNFRADMTLAGFDGFKLQRADQSFLFLGDGSEDGKVATGSLLVLMHKEKEVSNALEGAGAQPSEAEIAQEVAVMLQTNMYRPGIDVTHAELVPQLTWRRQEKTEIVGSWRANIFDMHHVHISVRSRRVPGALTDNELFSAESEAQADLEDNFADLLTEEEEEQLETVLSIERVDLYEDDSGEAGSRPSMQMDDTGFADCHNEANADDMPSTSSMHVQNSSGSTREQMKSWFGWGKRAGKQEGNRRKNELFQRLHGHKVSESSDSNSHAEPDRLSKQSARQPLDGNRLSTGIKAHESLSVGHSSRKAKEGAARKGGATKHKNHVTGSNENLESEYRKGLRPILWLTPDFPLKTEELLPLLDILANKVKAVRRLRELLTTKLPLGTFPVKVAIPIVPTIRVVVTFNKFEEISTPEEFGTPLSSPTHFLDSKFKEQESSESSSTWLSWIRGPRDQAAAVVREDFVDDMDPFVIPSNYSWIDMKEKKYRLKEKKSRIKTGKRSLSKPLKTTADSEGEGYNHGFQAGLMATMEPY